MTMTAVATGEDADAQRRERVKARWSILRQALLGSSPGGGEGGGSSGSDPKRTANNKNDRFHEHSMNYFPGFHVLDRTIIPGEFNGNKFIGKLDECDEKWNIVQNSYTSTKGHKVDFFTREVKEQQNTNQKSSIQNRVEALMSHRNYGVDNTGNVRVWDAEATLAGFCLSVLLDQDNVCELEGNEQTVKVSVLRKKLRSVITNNSTKDTGGENITCNLLELGAGQAGLAGLAMAAASLSLKDHTDSDNRKCIEGLLQMKHLNVVLTDGHPKCVGNNETCAKMMTSKSDEGTKVQIEARLLMWDSSSNGEDACRQMNKLIRDTAMDKSDDAELSTSNCQRRSFSTNTAADEGLYQLCLASDCVHFQEFHDGLLTTIARTLAVDGIALLCQPRRGTSLQNFMTLLDAVNASEVGGSTTNNTQLSEATNLGEIVARGPLFRITLIEDFYAKVSAIHTALLSEAKFPTTNVPSTRPHRSSQYDPDRHQPILLVLQKIRPFDEDIDGQSARHHVKMRVR